MDNENPNNIRVQGRDAGEEDQDQIQEQLDSLPMVEVKKLDPDLDYGDLDPETLDPTFDYRWVHNSPAKISKRLRRGFSFVRKSEDRVKKMFEGQAEGSDDFIYDGDRVLMKIQKDVHQIQQDRVLGVTRARLAAPKGQFRKKAKEAGYNVASRKYRGEPNS